MRHIKLFENFGGLGELDSRIKDLEDRGFTHVRTGMRNDKLGMSLLYHQIDTDEMDGAEWTKYIGEVDAKMAVVNEKIKKEGDDYVVYPKKGGKRLGTHETKKGALKQLAAIEISKAKRG